MGAFKRAIITQKGQDLLAKVLFDKINLEFTQIKTSGNVLSGDLASRTDIGTIKQAEKVASVAKQDKYTVKVSASFSNEKLTAGYYVRNIGLYAMDPTEGEILYSIAVADESTATADWMPPSTGASVSSLMVDLITSVSNATTVKLNADPTATATVAQIIEINEHLTSLDKSITTTGDKTLTGSVAGGIKINKVLGKCEQVTTTGAQLFNYSLTNVSRGVTVTIDKSTIKFNGTVNADTPTVRVATSVNIKSILSAGQTYYASTDNNKVTCRFEIIDTEDVTTMYLKKYTVTGNEKVITLSIIYGDVAQAEGTVISDSAHIMLNAGSTALSWEPYTGGIPSPSPDYPQEVNSVTLKDLKVIGKNVLNSKGWKEQNILGVIFTPTYKGEQLQYIEVNGQYTGTATNARIKLCDWYPIKGASYVLSGMPYLNNDSFIGLDKNGSGGSYEVTLTEGEKTITIEDDVEFYTVYLRIDSKILANKVKIYPMIRHIASKDGTYEPYTETSITLSQPITLNGVGEVEDELTPHGIIRKFLTENKPTINSVTAITLSNGEAGYRISCRLSQNAEGSTHKLLSNAFIPNTDWEVKNCCSVSHTGDIVYLQVSASDFPDLTAEAFTQYMQEVNLTFVTLLAEPVIEELPVADQLALRSILSYDGISHLFIESEVEPTTEVEYGINKLGAHTLTGLLTAQRNEIKLAELTSAV